jgi:hypothetical protein
MGRVVSGIGGELIYKTAENIIKDNLSGVSIILPDEKNRRVGQSVAASYL